MAIRAERSSFLLAFSPQKTKKSPLLGSQVKNSYHLWEPRHCLHLYLFLPCLQKAQPLQSLQNAFRFPCSQSWDGRQALDFVLFRAGTFGSGLILTAGLAQLRSAYDAEISLDDPKDLGLCSSSRDAVVSLRMLFTSRSSPAAASLHP